jgi:two-component system, OmpR family, KDP operon response regulator KdpE
MDDVLPRILVVDDEAQIRKFLRIGLEASAYVVSEARTGAEALAAASAGLPNLVVLDLGLPDMDGVDVIRRLREWASTPILVLSVRSAEAQKVTALDAGANDYLTKPFGVSELLARCRVLLRNQAGTQDQAVLECGELSVDRPARVVHVAGVEIHLSPKEYALLNLLASNRGKILTHQALLRQIWGEAHERDTHYLRVLVGHLRQKLADDPAQPRYIVTEQGVGYRLRDQ